MSPLLKKISRNGIEAGTISWSKITWLIISLVCFWHMFAVRLNGDSWKYVIVSDGAGYYAYLPATFIYHDLTYQFAEENAATYRSYPGCDVHFFGNKSMEGKRVNKYFIGTSILQAPFFLTAYFLSSAFNYPPGGYSFLFQAFICAAAIFYLLAGLYCIRKLLLKMNFRDTTVMLVMLLLFFGTNLYHYALEEPSMSHVYSFGTIAFLLLSVFKIKEKYSGKRFVIIAVTLALIVLIRPSNGIIVLLLPFFFSLEEIKLLFQKITGNKKAIFISSALCLLLFFLQSVTWKLSGGHWKEDTYVGEGLDLMHPHITDVLFSWRKGLFIYAPVLLFCVAGLFFVKPVSKKLILTGFLLVNIWIISSWHDWSYGGSYGMRPFVDTYAVFAILLAFFIHGIRNAFAGLSVALAITFLVFINLFQVYQYHNAILPYEYMTWNKYKRIFLKSEKLFAGIYSPGNDSLGYLPANSKFLSSGKRSFENGNDRDIHLNQSSIVKTDTAFSRPYCSKLDEHLNFCADLYVPLWYSLVTAVDDRPGIQTSDSLPNLNNVWIKASAKIWLEDDATDAKMVIAFKDEKNDYEWNGFFIVHRLNKTETWQEYSFAIPLPVIHSHTEVVSIYILKGDEKLMFVDDLEISFWEAPE